MTPVLLDVDLATGADHRTSAARPANARIAVDVDPAGFAHHFTRCLRRL